MTNKNTPFSTFRASRQRWSSIWSTRLWISVERTFPRTSGVTGARAVFSVLRLLQPTNHQHPPITSPRPPLHTKSKKNDYTKKTPSTPRRFKETVHTPPPPPLTRERSSSGCPTGDAAPLQAARMAITVAKYCYSDLNSLVSAVEPTLRGLHHYECIGSQTTTTVNDAPLDPMEFGITNAILDEVRGASGIALVLIWMIAKRTHSKHSKTNMYIVEPYSLIC